MTTIQLSFTIRTSSRCRSVQLVGSWDGYSRSLTLNRDSSRNGNWKGTFRFSAPTLQPGGRYWYYYITDGTHVSHDPARPAVIEPTTGRTLNVLDIPSPKHPSSHHPPPTTRRSSAAKGRSLSPSQIAHPHPSRPYETLHVRSDKFSGREMEALSRRYAAQRLTDSDSSDSDTSSRPPSYSSRSSHNSSPSSVSSLGSPITPGGSPTLGGHVGLGIALGACSCERYAVMKDGRRMRVECGGRVCGGASDSSSSSSDDESSDDGRRHKHRSSHSKHKKSGSKHKSSKRRGLFGRR